MFSSKEVKDQRKMDRFMEKYQLEGIDEKDMIVLERITKDLAGNGFFKTATAFSFAKPEEKAKVSYLSALVEQNWVVIRQLDRISKNIEKLVED